MLKKVIEFSLEHAYLVVMLAGILVVLAGYLVPHMAVDVFPELNAPTVVVLTEAGALDVHVDVEAADAQQHSHAGHPH